MTWLRKLLLIPCALLACSILPLHAQTVSCFSNGQRTYCRANTSRGVQLVRQRSRAACRLNVTWGFDRRGIWVDRGCGGDFLSVSRSGPGRYRLKSSPATPLMEDALIAAPT